MKITVFGASGVTGKLLLKNLLANGHSVNAYVRRENAIDFEHENLQVIVGQLSDISIIDKALEGCQAVVSTLGGKSLRKHASEIMLGIRNIVASMEKNRVDRLVYLSSIGARESRYFMAPIIRFMVCDIFLRIPLKDHSYNEEVIAGSGLNYTVLRPGGLSNEDKVTEYETGNKPIKLKGNPTISRKTVAQCITTLLEEGQHAKEAIWLLAK